MLVHLRLVSTLGIHMCMWMWIIMVHVFHCLIDAGARKKKEKKRGGGLPAYYLHRLGECLSHSAHFCKKRLSLQLIHDC